MNGTPPLYPDENTLAAMILGRAKQKEWRQVAPVLEKAGLPQVDPLMGGRYWPAVKAWLDRRNGVEDRLLPPATTAETENWHAID